MIRCPTASDSILNRTCSTGLSMSESGLKRSASRSTARTLNRAAVAGSWSKKRAREAEKSEGEGAWGGGLGGAMEMMPSHTVTMEGALEASVSRTAGDMR